MNLKKEIQFHLHDRCECMGKAKMKLTEANLRMFLKISVFGLKINPHYPKLGEEIERSFKEMFGIELREI